MRCHRSQLLWFRRLHLLSSRYLVLNSLRLLWLDTTPGAKHEQTTTAPGPGLRKAPVLGAQQDGVLLVWHSARYKTQAGWTPSEYLVLWYTENRAKAWEQAIATPFSHNRSLNKMRNLDSLQLGARLWRILHWRRYGTNCFPKKTELQGLLGNSPLVLL